MPSSIDEATRERAYLAALRSFYHPVATRQALDEVGIDEHGMGRVLSAELLGERIVVAVLDGRVVAMRGTCPHRGAGLDLGWVNPQCSAVVCRYHGFEWAATGRLHRIPALEVEGRHLPTGPDWRLETYPTVVKYGLIWVSLDPNPRVPVLDAAPADDPTYVALPIAEQTWRAGCGRITEAFLDTSGVASRDAQRRACNLLREEWSGVRAVGSAELKVAVRRAGDDDRREPPHPRLVDGHR